MEGPAPSAPPPGIDICDICDICMDMFIPECPEEAAETPVPDSTDADMLREPMLGSVCMGTPPIVLPIVPPIVPPIV